MAFTTWNPSDKNARVTLSGSNLVATGDGSSIAQNVRATEYKSAGQFYFEVTITSGTSGIAIGVGKSTMPIADSDVLGDTAGEFGYAYVSSGFDRVNGVSDTYGGSLTTGDVVSVVLDLDAGTLKYWKNGVDQGTSATGLSGSFAPMVTLNNGASGRVLTANFGDTAFAYTPPGGHTGWTMAAPGQASVSMSAMTAAAYTQYGAPSFANMTALAGVPPTGAATFSAMTALAGAGAGGVGTLLALTAAADAPGAQPSFAAMTGAGVGSQDDFGSASFEAMTATGDGEGGTALDATLIAPAPRLVATSLMGEVITLALRAPVPTLVAVNYSPAIITMAGSASVPVIVCTVLSGNVLTAVLAAPAPTLVVAGYGAYTMTAALRAPAPRLSAEMISAIASAFRSWVLNTRKGALTEYTNFDFNSFAHFNGVVLACGSSGIVVLGVQSADNTTAITARVRTGQESFESALHKRVPRIYTSYSSGGDMLFRTITTEGGTRTYSLPFNGITGVQQRRVPVGKGPKSRLWQFEVENVGGADFGVNDMLVYTTKLRRRVQ